MNNDSRRNESAEEALKQIVDGFNRFRNEVYPAQQELFKQLAHEQIPRAMFITCADSRVAPELITQSSPGDLFVSRNVGNVVPPYGQMMGGVSTAIEFAVLALNVQHIIICGHSDCGAMKAVLAPETLDSLPTVKAWLRHAEVAKIVVEDNCGCCDDKLAMMTEETSSPNCSTWRPTRQWHPVWPVASCLFTAGCTTLRPPASAPTTRKPTSSARSAKARCRWQHRARATPAATRANRQAHYCIYTITGILRRLFSGRPSISLHSPSKPRQFAAVACWFLPPRRP